MKNGGSMLKRLLVVSTMLLMFSMIGSAALADCLAVTTLAQAIADNAVGGCQHLDKIFSNFAYVGSDPTSSINASHQYTASPGNTADVHGWLFALPGNWTTSFTLSYDITIAAGFPLQVIMAIKDQENSGIVPNTTSITDTESVLAPPSAVNTYTVNVNGSVPTETSQKVFVPPATHIHTSSTFTPGASGQLTSYEQDWFESTISNVPEPATVLLAGGALLIFGWVARKKHLVR